MSHKMFSLEHSLLKPPQESVGLRILIPLFEIDFDTPSQGVGFEYFAVFQH